MAPKLGSLLQAPCPRRIQRASAHQGGHGAPSCGGPALFFLRKHRVPVSPWDPICHVKDSQLVASLEVLKDGQVVSTKVTHLPLLGGMCYDRCSLKKNLCRDFSRPPAIQRDHSCLLEDLSEDEVVRVLLLPSELGQYFRERHCVRGRGGQRDCHLTFPAMTIFQRELEDGASARHVVVHSSAFARL